MEFAATTARSPPSRTPSTACPRHDVSPLLPGRRPRSRVRPRRRGRVHV